MLLVSSVKTTDFMDRRGFVAILSVLHSKMLNSQLTSRLILEFLTISQSTGTFKRCNLELGGTRIKLVISRGSKIFRGKVIGSSNLKIPQCYTISMPFQIVLLGIPKFNCIYETVKDSYYHELFKLHKLLK